MILGGPRDLSLPFPLPVIKKKKNKGITVPVLIFLQVLLGPAPVLPKGLDVNRIPGHLAGHSRALMQQLKP